MRRRIARIDGCIACDLASGRVPLPGGRIHETDRWLVEHCLGPLGVGTLIVKPKRHVVRVADLTPDEAAELGGVLRTVSAAVDALTGPDQVYVTLWSHAGAGPDAPATPGHIHWVVQPITREQMAGFNGLRGPHLQAAMFDRNDRPPQADVEAAADTLRNWFTQHAAG